MPAKRMPEVLERLEAVEKKQARLDRRGVRFHSQPRLSVRSRGVRVLRLHEADERVVQLPPSTSYRT